MHNGPFHITTCHFIMYLYFKILVTKLSGLSNNNKIKIRPQKWDHTEGLDFSQLLNQIHSIRLQSRGKEGLPDTPPSLHTLSYHC